MSLWRASADRQVRGLRGSDQGTAGDERPRPSEERDPGAAVAATIVDLAGASPGLVLDGRSLAPLFADANAPWRSAILLQSPINRFQMPHNRFTGTRTVTRKYVKYDSGFEELFDLAADPHELNNEAANPAYANDLAPLRSLNDRLKTCAGAGCWVP
ncbi:MAG TPA: sulfatase/phosphatase domain-containing protein [Methyloceanibacter sp.]|nr:sulfatase/phosphatase domain-containing protein [Methyloceanibacter sp.]